MVQLAELPLEVLSNIPLAKQELAEVARTCRQLNQIFTPYLYRTFHYKAFHYKTTFYHPNLIKRFLRFVRTIRSRQDLAQHVQNVDLRGSQAIKGMARMEITQETGGETVGRVTKSHLIPERAVLQGWEIIRYFLKLLPQLVCLCIEQW